MINILKKGLSVGKKTATKKKESMLFKLKWVLFMNDKMLQQTLYYHYFHGGGGGK